jgi:hypothetical protein
MSVFIVTHREDGVVLGIGLGLVFTAKCDSVGQTHACTFETRDEATGFINYLVVYSTFKIEDLSIVEVASGHWRDLRVAGVDIGDMAFNDTIQASA